MGLDPLPFSTILVRGASFDDGIRFIKPCTSLRCIPKYGRVTPLIRQSPRGTSWIVCQPGSARQTTGGVVRSMNKPSAATTQSFSAVVYEFVSKDGSPKITVNKTATFSARFSNLRRKAKANAQKAKGAKLERKQRFLDSVGCNIQRAKSEIFSRTAPLVKKLRSLRAPRPASRMKVARSSSPSFARDWLSSGWPVRVVEGTAFAVVAFVICLLSMDLLSAHNFFAPSAAPEMALAAPSKTEAPPVALSPDPCENGSCKADLGFTAVAPVNPVATPPLRGNVLRPEDTAVYLQALKVAQDAMPQPPSVHHVAHVIQLKHALTHKTSALKPVKHTS